MKNAEGGGCPVVRYSALWSRRSGPVGERHHRAGPPVMVNAGREVFEAAGLTMDNMFSDAFEWAADNPDK